MKRIFLATAALVLAAGVASAQTTTTAPSATTPPVASSEVKKDVAPTAKTNGKKAEHGVTKDAAKKPAVTKDRSAASPSKTAKPEAEKASEPAKKL